MTVDVDCAFWVLKTIRYMGEITERARSMENIKRKIVKIIRQHLISGDLSRAFQFTNTRDNCNQSINHNYHASEKTKV